MTIKHILSILKRLLTPQLVWGTTVEVSTVVAGQGSVGRVVKEMVGPARGTCSVRYAVMPTSSRMLSMKLTLRLLRYFSYKAMESFFSFISQIYHSNHRVTEHAMEQHLLTTHAVTIVTILTTL